jgi:hypothetical protein
VFADTLAHELGHMTMDSGHADPKQLPADPNAAITEGFNNEGTATAAQYVVANSSGCRAWVMTATVS